MKAAIVSIVVWLCLVGCFPLASYSKKKYECSPLPLACSPDSLSCSSAPQGPTVDVPEFAIHVTLSPKAEQYLRNIHESVLVHVFFDGDALPGQGKLCPPMRDVFLGQAKRPLDDKNAAKFSQIRVSQSDFNRLVDKNYFVTTNTVSARKAAPNNLLWCKDLMSVRIEGIRGKTLEVPCKLIEEHKFL